MTEHSKISHFHLNNKFKVIHCFDNSSPLVSLQLYIKTGSAFETAQEAGFSHFIEHLVFKSTKNYPNNTIMDKASFYGGNINAYTEYESTCFYINLPSEFIEIGIELLSQLVIHANFSKKDFESEKKVVIEELKQYKNDPEETFIESIPSLIFKQGPYNMPIIGNIEILKASNHNDLTDFYKKFYQPQNAFMTVSGDFDLDLLKELSNKYFSEWEELSDIRIESYQETDFPLFSLQHIHRNISQNLLAFVLPELSDNNPDSYPLSLIGKAFAIGNNSRLYQRLYIKEKLIDNIKVSSISGISNGTMIILINPRKNSDINKIIEIFLEEYKDLSRFGLRPDEIENVKRELINSSAYVYEYMEVLGQTIGTEEILGDYTKFFEYEDEILKINRNDIFKQLNKYFNFNMLHILTCGKYVPDRNAIISIYNKSKSKNITNHLADKVFFHTLSNGLKILLKKVPGKSICGVSLALRVSQLDEEEHELGINQLSTAMLLYGNEKRDYNSCLDFCTTNGIQFAISCGKETSKIRLKCFSDNLLPSLEFIHDILFLPVFPQQHLLNLKKSIISNINRNKDYPQNEAVMLWKKMIFGKNSNLLSKDGTIKTLNTFNRKKVFNWYNNKILNSPATLCVVGDICFDDLIGSIEKFFGKYKFSKELNHRPVYISPASENKIIINKNSDQSIINLGGFCMPGKDTDLRSSMNILSQIIGGDISSRMFNVLREEYGLAYSAEFDYDLLTDVGYYDMFAIVDKKRENMAIDLMFKIQEDIKKYGVTQNELETAKNYTLGQSRLDEESVLSQAQVISSLLTIGYDYDFYENRENRIKDVTQEGIHKIANEYFNQEDEYLHILH